MLLDFVMPVLTHSGSSVVFVHIPKTGGTSVERFFDGRCQQTLMTNTDTLLRYKKTREWFGLRVAAQHLTLDEIRFCLSQDLPEIRVAMVRDPYARMESEFFYQIGLGQIQNRHEHFSKWALEQLRRAKMDPWMQDGHFRPQSDFTDPSVEVFRLEQGMEPLLRRISEALSIEFDPQQMKQHNRSDRVQVKWSPRLLAEFNAFYQNDFRLFDYELRDPGLSPACAAWHRFNAPIRRLCNYAWDVLRYAKRRRSHHFTGKG